MTEGHKKRLLFVNELQKTFKDQIDFFGFGFNPIDNKKDAIDPYHYSIALENSNMNNWFTEKLLIFIWVILVLFIMDVLILIVILIKVHSFQ